MRIPSMMLLQLPAALLGPWPSRYVLLMCLQPCNAGTPCRQRQDRRFLHPQLDLLARDLDVGCCGE